MDPFIFETENVLDSSTCKSIIKRFEEDNNKIPGVVGGGVVAPEFKKSTDLKLDGTMSDWFDVIDITYSIIDKNLHEYKSHLTNKIPEQCFHPILTINSCSITTPQIQKTSKDEYYVWHHDGLLNRILTYIIYLNDVSLEDGGSTEFLNGRSIQPKEGKMVIFPANMAYPHRGNKVKNGSKYIMTGFMYEGPPLKTHPAEKNNCQVPNPTETKYSFSRGNPVKNP